jgi:transketolase
VRTADGNNIADLVNVMEQLPFETGKPSLILARTVKGKGVSFIEDLASWHHRVPTNDEYAMAMAELNRAEKEWQRRYAAVEAR